MMLFSKCCPAPVEKSQARFLHSAVVGLFSLASLFLSAAPSLAQTTVTVTNNSGATRTLSDLIGYGGAKNTGAKRIALQPKNASDDISIAAGGTKNITVPKTADGDAKSYTISWLDKDGKEVETDIQNSTFTLTAQMFAFFERPDGGDFAVAYADGNGLVPTEGSAFLVSNGKISGYDDITFYNVGTDGFIQRDSQGDPTSSLLNGVTVDVGFQYGLQVVPEPSMLAFLSVGTALTLLPLWKRRRRATRCR